VVPLLAQELTNLLMAPFLRTEELYCSTIISLLRFSKPSLFSTLQT
jgi:hypothetical protein